MRHKTSKRQKKNRDAGSLKSKQVANSGQGDAFDLLDDELKEQYQGYVPPRTSLELWRRFAISTIMRCSAGDPAAILPRHKPKAIEAPVSRCGCPHSTCIAIVGATIDALLHNPARLPRRCGIVALSSQLQHPPARCCHSRRTGGGPSRAEYVAAVHMHGRLGKRSSTGTRV
jgi:hypothetical protein